MLTPDRRTRETKAAQLYMSRKGYPDARPEGFIPVEGQPCWYFYYKLPEGQLELEVSADDGVWRWQVTSFRIWGDVKGDPKARLLAS